MNFPIPDRPDLNGEGGPGPDYGILCLMLGVAIVLALTLMYGGKWTPWQ